MRFATLDQWLDYIDRVHPRDIDMGLERVSRVAQRMGLVPVGVPAIIVAGTNGKGSTCVAAEAVLQQLGWRVGTTLSPHVREFNERVRIDAAPCSDDLLCQGLAAVDAARQDTVLTYFEFSALLALYCFQAEAVDAVILEVGLGGRLDAFNVVDADVAVITSIGLDHTEYLGSDVEQIGAEKAGVLRAGQQVVVGTEVSQSVFQRAAALGCDVHQLGSEFFVQPEDDAAHWRYGGCLGEFSGLPRSNLATANCALGIHAALRLHSSAPAAGKVSKGAIAAAMASATLPGRMERISFRDREYLLDVAHNPAAAKFLAGEIAARYPGRRLVALLGGLGDKDVQGVMENLSGVVERWIGVDVAGPRGLSAQELARRVGARGVLVAAGDTPAALERAHSASHPGDVILVCGSFGVVDAVASQLRQWMSAGHGGGDWRG